MSAVLADSVARTSRLREWPDLVEEQVYARPIFTREPEPQQTEWQSLTILGGCGLLLFGVLRGSWSGLALAAVGGWLVYRNLSHTDHQAIPRESPDAAEPSWISQDLAETNFDPSLARERPQESAVVEEERPANPTDAEFAEIGPVVVLEFRELLPEELPLAHTIAYFHALERGGGSLPDYDYWRATEDFLRAAAKIVLSRAGE